MGNGIFIFFLGYFGIDRRQPWVWMALAFGGIVTISIFLFINITLNGHHVWLIGTLFLLLLVGLAFSYNYIFKKQFSLKVCNNLKANFIFPFN